jgi:putative membrane protein
MLAADHEQNLEQLQSLAARYNFQMSTSIDGAHQQALNQLKALSGLQLDRKFASQEIADHQKTIQEFQKMAKGAPTPEVKLYATQTLPVLQKHLEEARELQSTIPSSSSGKQQ